MIRNFKDKNPQISQESFVAENAVVIGDVTMDTDSSIWFSAVVRGDEDKIVIGKGSNIQDNATVHVGKGHPAMIGDYVTVGHNAVVHGATIEDQVLIGMNAVILNGVHIGTGSIIGAGTVLLENTVVPPNSLVVGVPGKVKGQLNEKQVDSIRENAIHYVERMKDYR